MNTRRNILKVLGMTAVAGTVSTDTIAGNDSPGYPAITVEGSKQFQDRVAESLESLAKAIRSGEATALAIDVQSKLELNNWLQHEVKIRVEILQDNS